MPNRHITISVLCAACVLTVEAQQPAFRISTDVVQIDVVVKDAQGRFVRDLGLNDFELTEDGESQTLLDVAVSARDAASGTVTVPLSPRVIIWFFDQDHLSAGGFRNVQAALDRFLADGFQNGDAGAVVYGSRQGSVKVTARKDELVAALRAGKFPSDRQTLRLDLIDWPRLLTEAEALGIDDGDREALKAATLRATEDQPELCARVDCAVVVTEKARRVATEIRSAGQRSLMAIRAISKSLGQLEGRKTLVLVSEGQLMDRGGSALRQVVADASAAGVSIYGIDAAGLNRAGDIEAVGSSGGVPSEAGDVLNSLAVDTGGIVVRNTNAFSGAIEEIAREAGNYYVLSYSPDRKMDGSFRQVRVRVKRAGLNVRARRGYLATDTRAVLAKRSTGASGPRAVKGEVPAAASTAPMLPAPLLPSVRFGPEALSLSEADASERLRPDRVRALLAREASGAAPVEWLAADAERASAAWERYQRGDLEGAWRLFKDAASPGAPPWVHYALGQCEAGIGRFDAAAAAWERVRAGAGEFEPVYLDLADAYLQIRAYGSGVAVLREAARRWPDDPEVHNALGVMQVRRDALDEAIQSFQQAVKVRPDDATAYFNLGRAYELRFERARRYARLARAWVANGSDLEAARESYRKYLERGGPLAASARDALERLQWPK